MHLDISLIDGEDVEHIVVLGFAFRVPTIANVPRRPGVQMNLKQLKVVDIGQFGSRYRLVLCPAAARRL